MNGFRRFLKKLFIVIILLSIAGGLVYLVTRPKPNLCLDGKQDNGETGIDCGGFCEKVCLNTDKPPTAQTIKINWAKFVEDGRNNYDFVASISNDNEKFGVASADYEFTYYDESGNAIGTKTGVTSIMPKGTSNGATTGEESVKYLIEDNVASKVRPSSVQLKLSNYKWEELTSQKDLDNLNKNIVQILEKSFEKDNDLKIYMAKGVTKNTSMYDFDKVDINIVVFGKNDEVLAVAKTDQLTMNAGNGWGFSVAFPNLNVDKSEITKVDYDTETNVFDSKNFVQEYRTN
jgi:hypothetical protein